MTDVVTKTFLGPFCKDCQHYRPTGYESEPNTDYWNQIRRDQALCSLTLPDFVTGKIDAVTTLNGVPKNTCMAIRETLCGLRGQFFVRKA